MSTRYFVILIIVSLFISPYSFPLLFLCNHKIPLVKSFVNMFLLIFDKYILKNIYMRRKAAYPLQIRCLSQSLFMTFTFSAIRRPSVLSTTHTARELPHSNCQTAFGQSVPDHSHQSGLPEPHRRYPHCPESATRWHC